MGNVCNRNMPIIRTTVLTKPILKPSGEVVYTVMPKQTVEGDFGNDKSVPLFIRKLHTWACENAEHHHTSNFELPRSGTLVVRRGQPFKITLTFNRPYNSLTDEIKFYFETGEKPLPGNSTMVCLSSYTSQGSSGWKSDFLPVIGTKDRDCVAVNLWVFTPHDCVVGDWKFSLQCIMRSEADSATVTYEHPERLFILFNPWCKKDTVYYPAEPMLEEYILNPSGLLFTGCRSRVTFKPWIFGQFESGILEACIYLIKRGFNFRTSQLMGDAAIVARNIARIVSADETGGVLQGRWSLNDFDGGRSPTTWSGSVAILKQYVENALSNGGNPEPVKYGHCFVYAGLVTTICRAVGIPCRCVTNYDSGRDTDSSLNIDMYYELAGDGSIEEVESNERVWSFHVWTDVWMRRPDLGPPYSVDPDWQALDPTPQRSSVHGVHRCGPAPLAAIKNGYRNVKYDVCFLLAEVNAEVHHWLKLDSSTWTVFRRQESRLGRSISTKTPDGRPPNLTFKYNISELTRIRQNISGDYTYEKGTKAEMEAIERPKRRELPMYRCKAKDVTVELEEKEYEYMGSDFNLKANVTNTHTEYSRTVHIQLVCESIHYTGKQHQLIKRQWFQETITPTTSVTFKLGIYESDYVGKLAEHTCLKQYVYLRVEGTDQIYASMGEFLLQKPHLEIKLSDEMVYRGKNMKLQLFFKNPLHRPLTKCSVSVEGTGLESMLYVRNFENIPAQCEWTGVVNVMPLKAQLLVVCVTFHCAQLMDLVGFMTAQVHKNEELDTSDRVGRLSVADTDLNRSVSINIG